MILELLLGIWIGWAILKRLRDRLYPAPSVDASGKWVLITGCDTGFGNGIAKLLYAKGFSVFACCYTEGGLKEFSALGGGGDRLVPIPLDVTKAEDIKRAAETVRSRTDKLWALVNNAGINQGSLCGWTTMEQYRMVMEVNFFGGVGMTKALLPLLTNGQGRIVNITSIAGHLAAPSLSPYCSSKFAFEGFSAALRREMSPWGVRVILISPGFMKTTIVTSFQSQIQREWNNLPQETKDRFGEGFLASVMEGGAKVMDTSEDPQLVVTDAVHAVASSRPHNRYWPGKQASWLFRWLRWLPDSVMDWVVERSTAPKVPPVALTELRAKRGQRGE